MTDARRTLIDIAYNHQNITTDLKGNLIGFTYTDNLSGEIDDLQIELEDMEQKWLSDWFPSKGSLIEAAIHKKYWQDSIVKTPLGKFEVDDISGGGPPSSVTIKALSVPETSSIRGEEKSKAWEKATLKQVANDVARANGLKLVYLASDNPKKDRVEQDSETDLSFLYRLCKDEGLCLKLSNKSIVILDEADYESKATVGLINRIAKETDSIQVKKWSFSTTMTGTYKACRVQSHDASKKKSIKATFTPPKALKVGRTLVVKQEVKSTAEAHRLAKKKLREANKEATKITMNVTSDKHIDAGMTFDLKGFGKLDGKYIVTQVKHQHAEVTIQLRKCLEGY